MTDPSIPAGAPEKILLATDLSARADRALDRATQLAGQWQAQLVVLHVLEDFDAETVLGTGDVPSWRRPPDPVAAVWKRLLADIASIATRTTVQVVAGDPATTILRTAEKEGCGLIVIGTARDELFGRFRLGRTVDRVLREAGAPVLVVKDRPRGPYHRIVAATDFSDASRHALEAAIRFFPEAAVTVFNAYDAPLAGRAHEPAAYRHYYRQVTERDYESFIAAVERPDGWQPAQALLEHGGPPALLREYVLAGDIDLVVLGTRGRNRLMEAVLGSVAKEIMNQLPCDALVVRQSSSSREGKAG